MEILSETRISQQVITRIGWITLTRRPLELGSHRPPGEIRITTLELGNIELRPIDLNSRTIRPTPRRRLPRPRAELRTSNLIIRMLIQILFPTDLTNTRRRLINITPRISRIPCRSLELVDLIRIVTRNPEIIQGVFAVGGVEVAPGAAFGHMRIKPCFRVVTCLYVAGAVFEQLGNGLVMVRRTAVTGTRLVMIGMVMVSTVAVIAVVHRVIVRPVPVGISGSIGITSSTRRVVLLRRIRGPGPIGPRALGAAVVAGLSRRVAATRAIRALVGPGPRTMSPTSMRMRGRATQPVGMRSTTESMSSTSPRHTQPGRAGHSSTSLMSRRRTPTMRPASLISRRTAPTPTGMTGSIGGSIGMRSPRTTTMTTTSIRMRGLRTTDMTATSIRMHRRRRGTRMRGRRPRRRVRGSRPITSTTGPTGAITSMTGPAGVGVTGAGVAMAGSAAGVGVRGLGTTGMTATGIRMRGSRPITSTTGPTGAITSMTGLTGTLASMTGSTGVGATSAGVAVTGSTAGIGVRGLGTTTSVTATPASVAVTGPTGIRMRGSRPIASMTGPAGVGVTGAGVGMAGSAAAGIGVRGLRTTTSVTATPASVAVTGPTGIRMRGSRPIASMTGPAGVGVTGAGVGMAGSAAAGIGVRGLRTTGMTATGIRMGLRRRGARMRGSRPIAGMTATGIRMRNSRPITSMAGPTGALASMAGPVGVGVTGAGVGMAGPAAGGIGMRGLRTTARVATAPVSVAVTGPTGAITSMTGSAGVGVRGFGTAARVAAAPAGVGVAGPAGAGVAGAAGVGVGGGGVGGCCGGVGGLGGLGVGMAGDGIETVISSHARTSTSRRGVGRCSRHCWNGARERIQTMISPRPRPGRRALVTTATGGRARLGFPALGADPTITASARARPSRLTTVTAAGRLTTGRLTTVPSGVMPAAGVRMTRPG